MEFITNFGSVTLLLPLAALLAITLWRQEGRRAALTFVVPLLACLSAMLVLKLYFLSCDTGHAVGITSPSGHTASATIVFGSIATVLATHLKRLAAGIVASATAVLILMIGVSRVAVGAHSIHEVVLGLVVGVLALAVFVLLYLRETRRPIRLKQLLLTSAAVIALGYGVPSGAEQYIKLISGQLRTQTNQCGAGTSAGKA